VFLCRRTRCAVSKEKAQERLKGEQYQFSGSILFFHFNFQMLETLLHTVMERTKIIRNSSFMNFNSSPKERYLEKGKKSRKNVRIINWV